MEAKKVIIIEDDKMLSTVFRMFLTQIGHELVGFYNTANEALEKIEQEKPDIVLMDIILKGDINGIIAANIINEKFNIPVVFISSSTDDKKGKDAVNSNAYGYLVKPINKFSLQIAIEIALKKFNNEQFLAKKALIIDNFPFICFTTDLNGKITWKNNFASFKINEQKLMSFASLFPDFDNLFFEETLLKLIKFEKKYENNFELNICKDDKTRTYSFWCYPIVTNNTNELIFTLKELKNNKQTKTYSHEQKTEYEILINGINEALYFYDTEHKLLKTNNLADKYSKKLLKTNNLLNITIFDILNFIPKFELDSLIENVFEGISHYLERQVIVGNEEYYLKISFIPLEINNKIEKYCVSLSDMSKQKELEKKLFEIKTDLTPIFQSSIQRFYLLDLNYNIVSFNDKAFEVIQKEFRYNLKKGDSILKFVPSELGEKQFKENYERAKMGESQIYKQKISPENKKEYWNESHLDPIINEKGEIYRILLWTLDITESQENIIKLSKSQQRYELVANGGNDGIWDWDILSNEIYLSPRWKTLLGFNDYELENKFGVRDSLVHPDDYQKSKDTLENYIKGELDIYIVELRMRHKSGEYKWVLERGEALKDESGKIIRLAGSIADITERKQLIEEISKTNNYLLQERKLFNNGEVAVLRANYDQNFTITYASINCKDVLGYSSEDLKSGKAKFSNFIHIDDIDRHNQERKEAIEKGEKEIKFSDYRITKQNGGIIWVRDFSTIINDNNNGYEMLGYYIDVTKYKDLENKILANEKRYSSIFSKANDAIFILKDYEIIDYNESVKKTFQYNDKELKTISISQLFPETQPSGSNSLEKFQRKIREATEGNNEPYYWVYKKKDGQILESEVTLTIIMIGSEPVVHTLIRDISIRKSIEHSLKESQEKLNGIYEAIPDIVFIINKDGKYLEYKADAERRLGTAKENIVGKNLTDFFEPEKVQEILLKIQTAIQTKKIQTVNYTLPSQVGLRNFEARISRINDNSILSIVRDVTV